MSETNIWLDILTPLDEALVHVFHPLVVEVSCFVFDPASKHSPKTKHMKLLPQADERRFRPHCSHQSHTSHFHLLKPYQFLVVQRVDVLVDGVAGELDLGETEVHRCCL